MSERIFTTAFGEAKTRHVCTTADELNFDNYTECGIYNIYVDLGDGKSKMYSLIVDKSATGACTTQTRTCSGKTEYRYYNKSILKWSSWETQSGGGGGSGSGLSEELKTKYDAATLQAMYNEVIEPSPGHWFIFDANTKAVTINDDYKAEYSAEGIVDLIVPFMINGIIVEGIEGFGYAMSNRLPENIKNIRLPNCIKYIGISCFQHNLYIESINIPTSATHIRPYAFAECASLKEVITPIKPNWEMEIGTSAFWGCTSLNNIDTIIDGVKEISEYCFSNTSVRNVIIPESVEVIRPYAFRDTEIISFEILNGSCLLWTDDNNLEKNPFSLDGAGHSYPNVIKSYKYASANTFSDYHNIPFIALNEPTYSKLEIDDMIGDIDTALTELHAYAENTYLGGETE